MEVWFETHATSTDNERGVASGHLDPGLSDAGLVQAAEMGRRYACAGIDVIYTSDLGRAVQTAGIAFGHSQITRIQDRRLRECDYGDWSGCPVEKLNEARTVFIERPFPGGESILDVIGRVEEFLNGLPGGPACVLLIAHRAPWYALEHLLNRRDLRDVVAAPWCWQPGWRYKR